MYSRAGKQIKWMPDKTLWWADVSKLSTYGNQLVSLTDCKITQRHRETMIEVNPVKWSIKGKIGTYVYGII